MELLPKPQHPRMENCSRTEVQTIVDVATVKLAGQINTKFDEKMRDKDKDTIGRVELMISNSVLSVKDQLHTEIRQMQEGMHVEIRKVLDERVSFILTKLERNTRLLDDLQATISNIKADLSQHSERNVKQIRSLETRTQAVEDDVNKQSSSLKQLRSAVEKLYDEFNRRAASE